MSYVSWGKSRIDLRSHKLVKKRIRQLMRMLDRDHWQRSVITFDDLIEDWSRYCDYDQTICASTSGMSYARLFLTSRYGTVPVRDGSHNYRVMQDLCDEVRPMVEHTVIVAYTGTFGDCHEFQLHAVDHLDRAMLWLRYG